MTNFSLRIAEDSDKWMVRNWRNHPDVRKVMLTDHVISEDEHLAWWNKTLASSDRRVLILQNSNTPVGVIIFNRIDIEKKTAWWGFYLDNASLRPNQKTQVWIEAEKAVIDYAGRVLGLYELYGDVVAENEAVWLLHKKFGFIECTAPEGVVESSRNVRFIKYVWAENKADLRAGLYLFASHNTDFLTESLRKQVKAYSQFPYQIKQIDFARYQVDLLDKARVELNTPSSCYIFLERIEDFFADIYTLPTEESLLNVEARIAAYLSFIRQIAMRGNRVYVADFAIQKGFPSSIEEQLEGSKIDQIIQQWNETLYQLRAENLIEILPYSAVMHRTGQSFSNKYWYVARAPFSSQFLQAYSQSIIGVILASHSLSARALVLDLDNTLWKGIIGDDGKDGIALGGDYPGNIYKELQALFYSLKQRGILLTICSKNTQEIALDAIATHPEMRLRNDDFVSHRINWNPKSQNIKELAQELNLGVQSLCFIDDNPAEREEVRRNVPGVFVPELPDDPAEWYQFICHLPELYVTHVNESDKRRADLYKKRVDIQKAQTSFTDRSDFLRSLDMDVCVEALSNDNFERTFQLFNKTNQFNTTTTRYTKEQLQRWIASKEYRVLHVRSKDKYSDEYEGVAALVIICKPNRWVIDNFVMSCRVMGRDIEKALLEQLVYQAEKSGVELVVGRYIASNKNMPVKDLYIDNCFSQGEGNNWLFDLNAQALPDISNVMRMHWNA